MPASVPLRPIVRQQATAAAELVNRRVAPPQIGEPISIVAGGVALLISIFGGAAVALGSLVGLTAATSIAIATSLATSLVLAGVSAATAAAVTAGGAGVTALINELTKNDTPEAKAANKFNPKDHDASFTSLEAVEAFNARLIREMGNRAGQMAALKVMGRFMQVHQPAPLFIASGIARDKAEILDVVEHMDRPDPRFGQDLEAKWANEFAPESWDREWSDESSLVTFILGIQGREGRRRAIGAGVKLWARWKNQREPAKLEAAGEAPRGWAAVAEEMGVKDATLAKGLTMARGGLILQAVAAPPKPPIVIDAQALRLARRVLSVDPVALERARSLPTAPLSTTAKVVATGGGLSLLGLLWTIFRRV